MSIDLHDAMAVVTGASSGIGRAAAHAFARRGARVVITDLVAERAHTVAHEIGDAQAVATGCDVTGLDDLEAVRKLALDRFGRIDLGNRCVTGPWAVS
ncbi:SDR family NAD(P)-dependent oxidoreductase [Streptomyces sp. NPDC091215]|uniref:SDR family NAD(P)-dependent oxidoreductase n=1 Tax=Streptomyces sp. NPDC091215 TaxID=3155192 RepID=UPI00343CF5FC